MPYIRWILCGALVACLLCILFPRCEFTENRGDIAYAGEKGILPLWTALAAIYEEGKRPESRYLLGPPRYEYVRINWAAVIAQMGGIIWLVGFSIICVRAARLSRNGPWKVHTCLSAVLLPGSLGTIAGIALHVVSALGPYSPWGGSRATLAPSQLFLAGMICGCVASVGGLMSSVIPLAIGLFNQKRQPAYPK